MRTIRTTTIAIVALGLLAGSAVGATAQDQAPDPEPPVRFTGKTSFGSCPVPEAVEVVPGKREFRGGHYCSLGVPEAFSDPRLQGTFYIWTNRDSHVPAPTIWAAAFTVIDDDGAWHGVPSYFLDRNATGTQVLVGSGAYEGFTIITTADLNGSVWNWDGWIIEGNLPPLPEEPAELQ